MQILERGEYCTEDPYVREIIEEEIRRGWAVDQQGDSDPAKKKGKSAQQQNLFNLRNNDNKFKYLLADDDGAEEVDYEEEENKRRRERDMQVYEPPRFKVLGYSQERGRVKRRPILRMTDLYLTNSPKVRRLINRVFDRHVYGREGRRGQGEVMVATAASNVAQLQAIVSAYEGQQEDYNFQNQQVRLQESQLEEYIIDRGQSKQNYFLFYKNQLPQRPPSAPTNNPLRSHLFLRQLHTQVAQAERKMQRNQEQSELDERQTREEKSQKGQKSERGDRNERRDRGRAEEQHDDDAEAESARPREDDSARPKEQEKKEREYFGQFRAPGRQRITQKFTLQDCFGSKAKASDALASSILDSLSFLDPQLAQEKYLSGGEDRLQLNLTNPYFFQPKLHTVLHREREFFQEQEYRAKLAEANKGSKLDVSLLSGYSGRGGKSKMMSGLDSEAVEAGQREEQPLSIERVIQTEIKNVYREPLKHSEVATKFDFVKFTFEEQCFSQLHRHTFPFHEHLNSARVKIEIVAHKARRPRANGLVINSEMRESNDKFSRKQDLSCTRGEFMMVEYIEENPLLMSDVGMCERMMVQVNYLELLARVKEEALHNKTFEEMEEERDVRRNAQALSFQKHCEIWRKCIRDTFGENGKQFFWEPKNNGKLIGVPEGPGVLLMESNLCNVPIVRKKPSSREFLLVREGKRWVLRRIESLYVSGQVQPHKKVFCPGSRTHTEFKSAYEKAFILKQIRQYGSVNFDQLKLAFKGETENSLRRALKNANTTSRDSKLYRLAGEQPRSGEHELTPEEVCLYERMQRSLCELRQVGITDIKTNEKMKNVLKEFNKKHFLNQQKITIARMIRQQLQLTSWYLTESFLKYKMRTSKIQINGFADPTNGRGGYSYINKPQKERTSREDMEERAEKQRSSTLQDLRKLKVDDSKERLRAMGHNEDEIDFKGRWQLINLLKNKEGTEFSRRERETKFKKIENQRKEINKNFNRLLAYLNDQTEEPAFDYARQKNNRLEHYMQREKEYYEKIKRKYGRPQDSLDVKAEDNRSDDSDEDD